jgi:hypothetical protein
MRKCQTFFVQWENTEDCSNNWIWSGNKVLALYLLLARKAKNKKMMVLLCCEERE